MRKYQTVDRCAELSRISLDGRKASFPAGSAASGQPKFWNRPNANKVAPTPASRAISDSAEQRIAAAVSVLPAPGAGGQLFVYEYGLPNRFAVATQADHAKYATSGGSSPGAILGRRNPA